MKHDRRFRFGLLAARAADRAEWTDLARKVEDLGYSSLLISDHFHEQLAPMPALTVAALATTTLRVGTFVLSNDYRHPVLLAKEAATVDLFSGGRFELGLGAGWMNVDYERSGIPHDPPGVRIERLEEAIAVLKGLHAPAASSFDGKHYQITDLDGHPKPLQQPRVPLLVGGGGKRVLSLAARQADIVGINPSLLSGAFDATTTGSSGVKETDQKLTWVRDAAGDRFGEIELNMFALVFNRTEDRTTAIAQAAARFGTDPAEIEGSPHVLIGTTSRIVEQIQQTRERWDVSYWVVTVDEVDAMAPVVAALAGT